MKTYYHATNFSNLASILNSGIELRNVEQCVYLCEKPEDCLKFAILHDELDILVCKCVCDKKDIIEAFDHDEYFFKCRCFASIKPIPEKDIVSYTRYNI